MRVRAGVRRARESTSDMLLAPCVLLLAWTVPQRPLTVAPAMAAARSVEVAYRASAPRMEFGDSYYQGAAPGTLAEGVYEVFLRRPLGIEFEEDGPFVGKSGVSVIGVVDDSNAAKDGTVQKGDKLIGVTAVQFQGAKWERKLFNCQKWGFEQVVDAIGSNDAKFDIYDVVLQFQRSSQ